MERNNKYLILIFNIKYKKSIVLKGVLLYKIKLKRVHCEIGDLRLEAHITASSAVVQMQYSLKEKNMPGKPQRERIY